MARAGAQHFSSKDLVSHLAVWETPPDHFIPPDEIRVRRHVFHAQASYTQKYFDHCPVLLLFPEAELLPWWALGVIFAGLFVCLDGAGCVPHLGCTVLAEHFAKLIWYKPHVVPLLAALESECADSKNWTSLEPIPLSLCSCGFRKESMTHYQSNPRWSVWQEVAKAVKYVTGFGFLKAS